MADYKKTTAPTSTITRDLRGIESKTGNLYQSIAIISRRANQISTDIKKELGNKLEEFASYTDNLEEVFENREQIEISKFYEKMPKPTSIATEEFSNDEISWRHPDEDAK